MRKIVLRLFHDVMMCLVHLERVPRPIVAMVVEGENAIELVRTTMGATNPKDAGPGTVRGDFGVTIGMNLVHGSDSEESAKREIDLFFSESEILDYDRAIDAWIIES